MSTSLDEARARALAWLVASRNADGSWGYQAGQPGRAEPTLLALAAGVDPAGALAWLRDNDLAWAELLLPAALSRVDAKDLRDRAIARILERISTPMVVDPRYVRVDGRLAGWGWSTGTAWVEPTAYAVLSLQRAGLAEGHVEDAMALFVDRQCDDGGWNYGNPEVRGTRLEGDLSVSGWAAMAVPAGPVADRALAFLATALAHPSTSTLSLATLAHVTHHRDVAAFVDVLASRQEPDGSYRSRADWTALAACAFDAAISGTHAFAA